MAGVVVGGVTTTGSGTTLSGIRTTSIVRTSLFAASASRSVADTPLTFSIPSASVDSTCTPTSTAGNGSPIPSTPPYEHSSRWPDVVHSQSSPVASVYARPAGRSLRRVTSLTGSFGPRFATANWNEVVRPTTRRSTVECSTVRSMSGSIASEYSRSLSPGLRSMFRPVTDTEPPIPSAPV